MKVHGNARLLPRQRQLLCERIRLEGWTVAEAAEAAGVCERTAYRWLARWDAGEPMTDRSAAPRSQPTKTPPAVEELIGHALLHEEAGRRHADLAGIAVLAGGHDGDGAFDIGIIGDDDRRMPAEFHRRTLHVLAGKGGQSANASVAWTDVNETFFSPGRQRLAKEVLAGLLDGTINPFSVPDK